MKTRSAVLAAATLIALPSLMALPPKTVSNVTVGDGAILDVVNSGEIETAGSVIVQGTGEAVFWTDAKITLWPGFRATPTGTGLFLAAVDSDWDGYTDVEESTDSDGDGMFDAWELRYGLDPYSASDAGYDSDGDGATNLSEFIAGRSPIDGNDAYPSASGYGLVLVLRGASQGSGGEFYGIDTSSWSISSL